VTKTRSVCARARTRKSSEKNVDTGVLRDASQFCTSCEGELVNMSRLALLLTCRRLYGALPDFVSPYCVRLDVLQNQPRGSNPTGTIRDETDWSATLTLSTNRRRLFWWIQVGTKAMARHAGHGLDSENSFRRDHSARQPTRDGALSAQSKQPRQSGLPSDCSASFQNCFSAHVSH
jgi:hypothetical protein